MAVQRSGRLLDVLRYVERNAYEATMAKKMQAYVMTDDELDVFALRLKQVIHVDFEKRISGSGTPFWGWRELGIELGVWANPVFAARAFPDVQFREYRVEINVSVYLPVDPYELRRELEMKIASDLGAAVAQRMGLTVAIVEDNETLLESIQGVKA